MFKKIVLLALTSILAASLISCSKEKEATKSNTQTENAAKQKTASVAKKESETNKAPKSDAQLASELVLKDTKVVKIFSINQKLHDNYKDLGPFYFIRGVDEKGRKTEVWVNNGKIFEIN
ncbi:hypothetical protein QNH39_23940 [Neobacillus novalis]|uniref:Lipoprotein n=1 Tax=Neobacillus novalis TaxID=220687 RepID=A0AA95MQZ7_9BACI|nr:hypothetical protein [Neobacillus novalis]WHY85626.1 hypothetical protein QNH39_23940 [Neobacillus novalis]